MQPLGEHPVSMGATATPQPVRWHWLAFIAVVTLGSAVNMLSQTRYFPKWVAGGKAGAGQDVIAGTEQAAAKNLITDNSHLVNGIKAPEQAANFLDLIPDGEGVAMCRDGASPEPVTYRQLRAQLQDPDFGSFFGAEDRVALVLENGKQMAVTLLAVMHRACAVPLNPTFTEAEICASLEQLQCSVVITAANSPATSAATAAAAKLKLRLLLLHEGTDTVLRLEGVVAQPSAAKESGLQRTVLLLKTSGTTSKGKVVPFSLRRLCLAARYNARCVELAPGSVCLSMMPLYHIAGISVNFLASLSAGAAILFYSGQFEVTRFVKELEREDELQPTWYFAVPAVHEAVLKRAAELGRPLKHRVKVIRSAGAAISQQSGQKLMELFNCAVTPAYGMTEALEITCPSAQYKLDRPGSVGPSISAEIKLIEGEVCIRGDLVMEGYEHRGANDEDPNSDAWTGGSKGAGYLRTGDLGHMDEDGWLYLTGRSKEMINRGGETINPHEVEPALAKVPGIELAVCFSAPHQALGECIGTALVLQEGLEPWQLQPKDILARCEQELSEVMRPEVFVYLPRHLLPTTATKKFVRAGLVQKLGLTDLLTGQGGTFAYNGASFESCDFALGAVRDSLGQLREANAKEAAEQQLKDCIFGVGILQVVMKHWFEGRFAPWVWSYFFPAMTEITGANMVTMTLFFLLSGHTASVTTTWSGRLHRWAGLYLLMTFTAIPAIQTNSMRIDWFFASLLCVEVPVVLLAAAAKPMGAIAQAAMTAFTILGFLFLAAWSGGDNFEHATYYQFVVDTTGWDMSKRLSETWGNLFFGNIDFKFGTWRGAQHFLWATCFAVGFGVLPLLSQVLWSQPRALKTFERPEARFLGGLLALVILTYQSYTRYGDTIVADVALQFCLSLLTLLECLAFVACLGLALGKNQFLQQVGRNAMGALMTHTMFGTQVCPRFYGSSRGKYEWPFHDTLQPDTLQGQPILVLCLFALPSLYILSVGRWVQFGVDKLLLCPLIAFPLWLLYVGVSESLLGP